jgi:uncharacterized protein YxeA
MKKHLIIFLIAVLPLSLLAQTPQKGPLDKKTFIIDITKEGKKKPMDPDEIKFDAAKFKSKTFADWGFTKAMPYKITSIDSTTTPGVKIYSFTVETINDIKEVMTWEGTIKGEDIDGTAELVSAKGEHKYSYTYTGKLKGKPGKK